MAVQDDKREIQMVDRFNLEVPEDRKRADIDAYLVIDNKEVPFELKSTTGKGISTVRDLGPGHFAKWVNIHWLFGVYDPKGEKLLHAYYASPDAMVEWISSKSEYVRPDLSLIEHAKSGIGEATVTQLLGEKDFYTRQEAKWIMKNQWSAEKYAAEIDVSGPDGVGYSLDRMVEIMRDRCQYVMARGATLNNPHIPMSYVEKLPKISSEPAASLRNLVRTYFSSTSITDEATA
ncbi:hypothetical protein [Streptomyces ziwulingensis]|uniref:Endonuclease n=1 Tax=Streptomyces ziwulingensis TaxID=1045501 RepID=A0ABP9BH55_9ACTN